MGVNDTGNEVVLSSGNSTVRILKYGATVLSWTVNGKEQLFLSEKAVLDGTKAVRGGIPLVFPVFGKATEGPCAQLPQHGFARNHVWELLGQVSESPLTVQFGLGPEYLSEEARAAWPYDFSLVYTVVLQDNALVTKLTVDNTDSKPFEFNVLFHTYFRIPDVDKVSVDGLQGAAVTDKVSKTNYSAESTEVRIAQEVDRVYGGVPDARNVTIKSGDTQLFHVVDRKNLPDVVVWNPWIEKANGLGDFYPKDGYKNMICVETGSVDKWTSLQPGQSWEASQTLKVML
ncbi:glucose-6-phosphate 1-epimerase [Trichomonascus vanleenenianus]|uniref:glucose-6-phosphate 1-epimerase n=1 Tax=Trichomonascus vanleenenianus TaxID=2268995 RepID=UPI003ECB20CB